MEDINNSANDKKEENAVKRKKKHKNLSIDWREEIEH